METATATNLRLVRLGNLRVDYRIPLKDQLFPYRYVHPLVNETNFPTKNVVREMNQVGIISFGDGTVSTDRKKINGLLLMPLHFRSTLEMCNQPDFLEKVELPLSIQVIESTINLDGVKFIQRFYFDFSGREIQAPMEGGDTVNSPYAVLIPRSSPLYIS